MFFVRLRKGSKWVFIAVIIAFAFTFLFAGVGSGSSGGGDIIQELLGMRGGSDPVKVAEKAVAKNPHNAIALVQLAQAYDAKQRRDDAINTYETYLKLKPKDSGVLLQLSRLQQEVTSARWARYSILQSNLAVASGPLGSDPLPALGTDSLLSAYSSLLTTKVSNAYGSYVTAAKSWEDSYQRYAALQRAQINFELGQAAASATDYPTAIKAFESYLKLTPKSPQAASVKQALAQLRKISGNG
jgi:tetratricopeptide (TPR) repeat protein